MTTSNKNAAAIVAILAALFSIGTALMLTRGGPVADGDSTMNLRDNGASSSESGLSPDYDENAVGPERATLEGEYVACLPKQDNFSTDDCVPGMKTDDGTYYAVNFMLASQTVDPPVADGERFSANGVITPVEMLSAERWRHTIAKGIFSVTDSVRRF